MKAQTIITTSGTPTCSRVVFILRGYRDRGELSAGFPTRLHDLGDDEASSHEHETEADEERPRRVRAARDSRNVTNGRHDVPDKEKDTGDAETIYDLGLHGYSRFVGVSRRCHEIIITLAQVLSYVNRNVLDSTIKPSLPNQFVGSATWVPKD